MTRHEGGWGAGDKTADQLTPPPAATTKPKLGTIGGWDPGDRLLTQVLNNCWFGNPPDPPPSILQITYVLRGLADYSAIQEALHHSGSEDPAMNMGRWFHAVADRLERKATEADEGFGNSDS